MSRRIELSRLKLCSAALIAGFAVLLPAGKSLGEQRPAPPVTMEELEVRGVRENPDRLYVSVPNPIFDPAPVRFDLFAEDLREPVFPPEFDNASQPNGGSLDDGDAAD